MHKINIYILLISFNHLLSFVHLLCDKNADMLKVHKTNIEYNSAFDTYYRCTKEKAARYKRGGASPPFSY